MESSIHTEQDPAIRSALQRELASFGHVPSDMGENVVRQTVTVNDVDAYEDQAQERIACDQRWEQIGIDYS